MIKIEYQYSDTGTDPKNPFLEINPNQQSYIYDTIQVFVNDVCELTARTPEFRELFTVDNTFSRGKGGRNSCMSFASGLCNKQYRGKRADFSKNQIKHIELIMQIASGFYTQGNQKGWFGTTLRTVPYTVKFVKKKIEVSKDLQRLLQDEPKWLGICGKTTNTRNG